MQIGQRIKQARKHRGLTQKDLGLMVGFDEKNADVRIAQYESEVRTPKPEMRDKIAKALDMDVNGATDTACADFVIGEIRKLSETVGIPKTFGELGVENPDLDKLAENSLLDVCAGGNPFMPTKEQAIAMFKQLV